MRLLHCRQLRFRSMLALLKCISVIVCVAGCADDGVFVVVDVVVVVAVNIIVVAFVAFVAGVLVTSFNIFICSLFAFVVVAVVVFTVN